MYMLDGPPFKLGRSPGGRPAVIDRSGEAVRFDADACAPSSVPGSGTTRVQLLRLSLSSLAVTPLRHRRCWRRAARPVAASVRLLLHAPATLCCQVCLIGDAWSILHELHSDEKWSGTEIAYVSRTDMPSERAACWPGRPPLCSLLHALPSVLFRRLPDGAVLRSQPASFVTLHCKGGGRSAACLPAAPRPDPPIPRAEWAAQCLQMLKLDSGVSLHDLAHHHEVSNRGHKGAWLADLGLVHARSLSQHTQTHTDCSRACIPRTAALPAASTLLAPRVVELLFLGCPATADLPGVEAHALPAHPRADRHPV